MEWFVLYTKPRTELKTALELEKLGFESYCPLITEFRKWSDRTKKVQSPLFKSYIFIHLEAKDRTRVFEVPTVVRYLNWLRKPAVVREEEIQTLKDWLGSNNYEEVQVHSFTPGDKITINNGALKGRSATIQEVGRREVRLVLESLGFIVTTKIRDIS